MIGFFACMDHIIACHAVDKVTAIIPNQHVIVQILVFLGLVLEKRTTAKNKIRSFATINTVTSGSAIGNIIAALQFGIYGKTGITRHSATGRKIIRPASARHKVAVLRSARQVENIITIRLSGNLNSNTLVVIRIFFFVRKQLYIQGTMPSAVAI